MNVSIVIPNYNGRLLLEKHVPSVVKLLRPGDECIIVDDCSTDDSVSWLHEAYPSVKVVTHAENLRYAASCNDGVRIARHDIVIMLNNDVSPENNILEHLLPHFNNVKTFAVGCAEHDKDGMWSGRSSAYIRRGLLIHRRAEKQHSGSTLWASGGSMAVRRSLYLQLGGLDTMFYPAYQEDLDLSYRAAKAGYAVLFEEQAKVFHDHKTTNISVFGEKQVRVVSRRNSLLFMWKNITDIDLLYKHLLWLPYHLMIDSLRTRGEFALAFLRAVLMLPRVLRQRQMLKSMWMKTDREVLRAGHD